MKGDKRMKAVLISIQPKWCNLIANGKKTFEIRKTKPKIETPFKCYIYCTSSNIHECLMMEGGEVSLITAINYKTAIPIGGKIGNGKVIGEFICDGIITDKTLGHNAMLMTAACLSPADAAAYCTKDTYGWHISDLKIYYEPNEVTEFYKACNKPPFYDCTKCADYGEQTCFALERPPQSWCYVENLENKR